MGIPTIPDSIIRLVEVLSNASVIFATIFGFISLFQWRRQLRFGDRYKNARKIIGLTLKFKRELRYTREYMPCYLLVMTGPTPTASDIQRELQQLQNELSDRYGRLEMLYKTIERLYEENIEAESFLGDNETELIRPLSSAYEKLNYAFIEYGKSIQCLSKTYNKETLEKFYQNRDFIFSKGKDDLENQVEIAISNIRRRLKKYVA